METKKYRLGNRIITIDERAKIIGEGQTGDVYSFGANKVLKVFNDDQNDIDIKTAEHLTHIKSLRILLPRELLFNGKDFKGYLLSPRIKHKNGESIIKIPTKSFIDNTNLLEKDIDKLSDEHILLNGISPDNTIFNGKLYLSDPRMYSLLLELDPNNIRLLNYFQLHLLLVELIGIDLLATKEFDSEFIEQIKDLLGEKEYDDKSSDFFRKILSDDINVYQFVKRFKNN